MEIDFGGIGKEYAVDRAYDLLLARCPVPFLVNFGGPVRYWVFDQFAAGS